MTQWLEQLERDPVTAFDDLVMGRADVGVFSRASLGEVFVEACRENRYRSKLDEGAHGFLTNHLLGPVPQPLTPQVWGAYLQDVFRGLATLGLEETGTLLRKRHQTFRRWLSGYYLSDAIDPEEAFLRALAWAQTDASFAPLWRRLALGQEGHGVDYVDIGLLGMGKARTAEGNVPQDAPLVLLTALADLASLPQTSEAWWRRKVRSLQAAYRCSDEVWFSKLEQTLQSRKRADRAEKWLAACYPVKAHKKSSRRSTFRVMRPVSLAENDHIADLVTTQTPDTITELDPFLQRHRDYAEQTGDSYFLVRTFNRLANITRHRNPEWALALVEDALEREPRNPHNWTVKARCLEAAGRDNDAIETVWTARIRFPLDSYVHTELGRLLRAGGDLETSQAVYEEVVAIDTENAACRTGLAEVLAERGRIDEAIQVYGEAVQISRTNGYARDGLAKVLIRRRRDNDLAEAERLLRGTMELSRGDTVCRSTLAELLKDQQRYDEAANLCRETVEGFPRDTFSRNILAEILFVQGLKNGGDETLREEARKLFQEAVDLGERHAQQRLDTFDYRWRQGIVRGGIGIAVPGVAERELRQRKLCFELNERQWSPAQRLGRALLAQGQATRATDPAQRQDLFDRARRLLSLTDTEAGDYAAAFIEARGFLLIAEKKTSEALAYFRDQIDRFGRGSWTGIQLGYAQTRLQAGQKVSFDDWRRLAALGPEGAVTALVARVLTWLARDGDEELRNALAELYPHATELTSSAEGAAEGTTRQALLLANLVRLQWFKPADIHQVADLNDGVKLGNLHREVAKTAPTFLRSLESLSLAA